MELVVLGAGPAYTDRPGALGSSYLVRSGEHAIVLDLGQGVFPSLAGHVEPSRLDGIAISHLHPDHWIDLVSLRHYLRYEFEPPRRLRILAPGDLAGRLDALHATTGFTAAALDIEPLEGGPHHVGPFTLETVRVTHTPESHAIRVALTDGTGPGLVYSGDCGRADDLVPLIRPGDTLLTEVSFGPGPVPVDELHLSAPSIAALARATRPATVLLTHLQMGYDPEATLRAASEGFDGSVCFVWPGDSLTIGESRGASAS
jgi:ribonuclease BN (tRNA processing enzyme)